MVVRERELSVVSCCGCCHGESVSLSFCFINTWIQKHYIHQHGIVPQGACKITIRCSDGTKIVCTIWISGKGLGRFSSVSTVIAFAIFRVIIFESGKVNYCWPSPTQSFLVLDTAGLMTTFSVSRIWSGWVNCRRPSPAQSFLVSGPVGIRAHSSVSSQDTYVF
jgi:hypothetical protein